MVLSLAAVSSEPDSAKQAFPLSGESAAGAPPIVKIPQYFCSSQPKACLDPKLGDALNRLSEAMKMRIWLLVQNGSSEDMLDGLISEQCFTDLRDLEEKKQIAVLVDSPGGDARSAYQLARHLKRHCGGYVVLIPRSAKSAATLFTLGADRIVLHPHGELGPLDAQIPDFDREEFGSALDEVQSLERLQAQALSLFDQAMFFLSQRLPGKKQETLVASAFKFAAEISRPLFEKIDTVHFTKVSRILKVAEAYAVRLLHPKYDETTAKRIARQLVYGYPEHGFVIDSDEARSFGLEIELAVPEVQKIFDEMIPTLRTQTHVGLLKKV